MACGQGALQGLAPPFPSARADSHLYAEGSWFRACGQTNISCKNVNGKLVEVGKWPWQVSILFLGMSICSGSLIHRQWVLTAAHCLQRSKDPLSYSVKMGVQSLSENGTERQVARIMIHEDFTNLSQDLALLRLRDSVSWSPLIQPVCLPNPKLKPSFGSLCWMIGWGKVDIHGCLGAGDTLGALSTDVPADLDAPCAPSATCPSGRRRFPRQVTGGSPPPSISQYTTSKASHSEFLPPCGFSYERDPTLRDPESMARRWPWMVSVRANGTHICAGTLIASEWVLTAAHCMTESDVTYSVRAGSPWIDRITKTSIDTLAKEVIVHSRYRASRYWSWVGRANDIALLNLERPLQYSKYVWPICLPGLDYSVKDYSLCTVTGWGLPRVDGQWPQFRTIQEKEVTILNSTECDSLYRRFSKIPSLIQIINSQMICAKDVDREKFCYEISGEPLACPVQNIWHLVGVVSWGPGCKKSEAPPIYVHISSYQQWIWDCISGQTLPAPSRALLLALLMLLSFLAAL